MTHPSSDLRRLYDHGHLLPFVGAGASMSVVWKDGVGNERRGLSWRELVDQATKLLECTNPELLRVRGSDLQILEYFRIRHHSFAPLTNWLTKLMDPPDQALRESPIHRGLIALERCPLIYTTNFDDFIERSFRIHGRPYRPVALEAHMGFGVDQTQIIKFHGDWNHPDEMVLSESQYQRRLKLETSMDRRLQADVLGRAIFFIGYSFSDINVSYLFRLVTEQFGPLPNNPTGRRAYITVADPSDFEIRLFQDRNIEVIPVSGSFHTSDVAELLAGLGG